MLISKLNPILVKGQIPAPGFGTTGCSISNGFSRFEVFQSYTARRIYGEKFHQTRAFTKLSGYGADVQSSTSLLSSVGIRYVTILFFYSGVHGWVLRFSRVQSFTLELR